MAGILGDAGTDREGKVGGEGLGSPARPLRRKNDFFSLEMSCFGEL